MRRHGGEEGTGTGTGGGGFSSYFFHDGPQRHVAGQRVHAQRGQLHHAAALGALEGQAEGPPDGVVGRRLQQRVQAALAEGVRAGQHARVREEGVAHGAGQLLLQEVHHVRVLEGGQPVGRGSLLHPLTPPPAPPKKVMEEKNRPCGGGCSDQTWRLKNTSRHEIKLTDFMAQEFFFFLKSRLFIPNKKNKSRDLSFAALFKFVFHWLLNLTAYADEKGWIVF